MKLNVGDKVLVEAVVDGVHFCEGEVDVYLQEHKTECFRVHKVYPYNEKTYEDGLSDAWMTARKLIAEKEEGGLTGEEITQIFGKNYCNGYGEIFDKFTADEAADKIAQWKGKQEIHVGDVLCDKNMNECVVSCISQLGNIFVIYSDGSCGVCDDELEDYTKTGRTIDIKALLEQIGGAEDARDII